MSWRKETNKSSCSCYHVVNPLLIPLGGLIYFEPIWGEKVGGDRDRDRGLFNSEKMMVSVLHKELGYKVEKLKYNKTEGHAAEEQNQIRTFRW